MNPGDDAPYYGVLVPQERYSFYREEIELCKFKEEHQLPCEPKEFHFSWPLFFAGILFGFVAAQR
jgi:hypothetical protein